MRDIYFRGPYPGDQEFVTEFFDKMDRYGISHGALARRAGIHYVTLSRWRYAKTKPNLQLLVWAAEALELLIAGKEPQPANAKVNRVTKARVAAFS